MRPVVAVAGSRHFADLDDNWDLLRDALAVEGTEAVVVAWDADDVDWAGFDAVLVLYCWGYVRDVEGFVAWARRVERAAVLVNPRPVLVWNSDKTYLADLAAEGVPIVPTVFVTPSSPAWSPPADDWVIKPTVGSGGLGAARYTAGHRAAADRHIRRLHASGRTAMVQAYQAAVDAAGETSLVYLGGAHSHTVTKGALLVPDAGEIDRLWEREVITAATARPDQVDVADAALAAVSRRVGPVSYARVDLVDDADGRPVVLEVELVEPSLWLTHAAGSAGRLAAHVRALIA